MGVKYSSHTDKCIDLQNNLLTKWNNRRGQTDSSHVLLVDDWKQNKLPVTWAVTLTRSGRHLRKYASSLVTVTANKMDFLGLITVQKVNMSGEDAVLALLW